MEINRPLDVINQSKGKKIQVELKNGKVYRGVLVAWDVHPNLVLTDAEEVKPDGSTEKLQWVFLRGDMVAVIKPLE